MEEGVGFGDGGVEVIVDDNTVETGSEREFIGSAGKTLLYDFFGVGATAYKTLAQDLDAGRLDEEAEGAVTEVFF